MYLRDCQVRVVLRSLSIRPPFRDRRHARPPRSRLASSVRSPFSPPSPHHFVSFLSPSFLSYRPHSRFHLPLITLCGIYLTFTFLRGHKVVLHDRPPSRFRRASPVETHDLFQRLIPTLSAPSLAGFLPPCDLPRSTPFTHTPAAPSDPAELDLAGPFTDHEIYVDRKSVV